MLHFVSGNLFDGHYDAIVNPVNCVGVMGKGLALEFKNRYPANFVHYKDACAKRQLKAGGILVFEENGQTIINAATKYHWRNPSERTWVDANCRNIAEWCVANPDIRSVAIPKLGCGLGGLEWLDVRKIVKHHLSACPQNIYVFGEDR